MTILCNFFGHKIDRHHYGRIIRAGVDGIDREHARVVYDCERCDQPFTLCQAHLPKRHAEKLLEEENAELRRLVDSIGAGV